MSADAAREDVLTKSDEPSSRYVLRKCWEVLRPHRRLVWVSVVLTFVFASLAQVNPLVFTYAINTLSAQLQGNVPMAQIVSFLLILVAVLVAKEAGVQGLTVVVSRVGEKIRTVAATEMSNKACQHLVTLDQDFFDSPQNSPSAITERIDRGIEGMSKLIKNIMVDILPLFLTSALALAIMFYTSWIIGVVTSLIIPLFAYLSYHQAKVNQGTRVAIMQGKEERSGSFSGFLTSIMLIKAYRWESVETRRIGTMNESLQADEIRHHYVNRTYDGFKMFVGNVGQVIVLGLSAYLVATGYPGLSIGSLLGYVMLYGNVAAPVVHLHRILDEYQEAVAFAGGYFAVLETKPALAEPSHPMSPATPKGRMSVRVESFAYPMRPDVPVLRDVNLDLEPGGLYALVGVNGAGKTTLAKLLLRFYDPDSGQILLDGVDLRQMTKSEIRSHMGIVLQEDFYVRGTIRDNLSEVRPGVTEADQWAALEEVGLTQEIAQDGLDRPASALSKGQRQRLAIARAFLKDPRILILDEPTAAIDPLAVRDIDASLRRICKGRTTLLISHNMSLVLDARRIFVMENGRIVQSGTHRELFAQSGAYRRIMEAYIETLKIEKLEVPSAGKPAPVRFMPEGPAIPAASAARFEPSPGEASAP